MQAKAQHWLVALNQAVNKQFPKGIRGGEVSLMSDNGCQPTSVKFMQACCVLGIKQAFTSYNNPKANADTERFIRTMQEELVWLREWKSPIEFMEKLAKWIDNYNKSYLHSSLGYQSPEQFERKLTGHNTLLEKAC